MGRHITILSTASVVLLVCPLRADDIAAIEGIPEWRAKYCEEAIRATKRFIEWVLEFADGAPAAPSAPV